MTKMYIPTKLKVGFQHRKDTFTGKLAYIIYYDEKGALRKEKSWEGWIDESITTLTIDNVPQSNFILNKGVQRYGHFGSGRSVIRIYDPRDFEFEITVDNLLGLLLHSDVSKRDIQEQCIYAFDRGNLILLPVNSKEYLDAVAYTTKQTVTSLSTKDLMIGYRYSLKKSDEVLTYIGYHPFYSVDYDNRQTYKGKKHVFKNSTGYNYYAPSRLIKSECYDDAFPELFENYFKSLNGNKIAELVFQDIDGYDDQDITDYRDYRKAYYIGNIEVRLSRLISCRYFQVGNNEILGWDTSRYFDDLKEFREDPLYINILSKFGLTHRTRILQARPFREVYDILKELGAKELYYKLVTNHLVKENE